VWTDIRIETRHGVCIEAVGQGSKIRGRTFGPHRPTLIVVDDLENDESVESPAQREKTFNWFNRAVLSAGAKGTNVFVLGTALHRDDTLQRLKRAAGWECRTFPSILHEPANQGAWRDWQAVYCDLNNPRREADARRFYDERKAEMDEGAVVLWPDREPLYDLMCLRTTIGESAFQAEKQGNPTSLRTAEWPGEYFDDGIWFERWPQLRLRVIALDPSKGGSETGDYSAYVMLGVGHDGMLYVDADLARRDTTQMVEDGLMLAQEFPPDAFAVEVNQFQELLRKQFADASRQRGIMLPIYGITNTINKRTRIRKLTPYVRGRQFRFRGRSPGAELLVEQLREFPTGRHDDGPDSLEMAIKIANFLLSNGPADDHYVEFVTT
jgi:predicted phage terminase large subunit-like protein